jgi:hypothetical protein
VILEDATRVAHRSLVVASLGVDSQNVDIHSLCKLNYVCVESYKERHQSVPSCMRDKKAEGNGEGSDNPKIRIVIQSR